MEKFTVESYQDAKIKAVELGINPKGRSKQSLVDIVNDAIEAIAKGETPKLNGVKERQKSEKWHDNADRYSFNEGDVVEIVGTTMKKKGEDKAILAGRKAKVVGPSLTPDKVRVVLFDKEGNPQNCVITVEVSNVVISDLTNEVVVEVEDAEVVTEVTDETSNNVESNQDETSEIV